MSGRTREYMVNILWDKEPQILETLYMLEECYKFNLVDPTEVFAEATHVKARANGYYHY